ncbi:atpase domain prokaryote protein [Diplodia corticola]|uniref:Atpase domain prokaryote protein n=1 Tax=Diplodia corticola TaxID=236234 RepID=A0A1J9RBJ4_9PEZI|nr:atpase domain prokaryote protein [Diplodia corticola]OJD37522.1 atpase domain prokaryote protein [Diplodia corticola]
MKAPAGIRRSARYGYLRSPRHIPRHRLYPGHPLYGADWNEEQHHGKSKGSSNGDGDGDWKSKLLETTITTLGSVAILGGVGFAYQRYYKAQVLSKMENAFDAGFSSLELASLVRHSNGRGRDGGDRDGGANANANANAINGDDDDKLLQPPEAAWWIQRDEQRMLDDILAGRARGHYYLLTGEKGTGKTSMLLEGMRKAGGEGVALLEAHGDPEIFRVRLGKALDFEFHEDYIGSLFSFRGPRDTTALLDIERALDKLEKVALRRHGRGVERPLVLVVNGVHLLRDDEDGRDLLELVQQRAELWSASGLVTLVLSSDDYWISERLIQQATRMQVLNIPDVPREVAVDALKRFRFRSKDEEVAPSVLHEVYSRVGGRLRFLNQVARADNMLEMCEAINRKEKIWLLNQCWILGEEMDDDVMDQQKFCAAAMVLASALVDLEDGKADSTRLPQVEVHKAREIMTRADFLQQLDHINIVAIDSNAMVRADSVPMQNAFREICREPGFKEHLQRTVDRIGAIESLGRTRELVLKDLVGDGEYQLAVRNAKGYDLETVTMKVKPPPEDS